MGHGAAAGKPFLEKPWGPGHERGLMGHEGLGSASLWGMKARGSSGRSRWDVLRAQGSEGLGAEGPGV